MLRLNRLRFGPWRQWLWSLGLIATAGFAQQTYTPYTITTLAGSGGFSGGSNGTGGAARFDHPDGVAVDGAGTVYVADSGNHAVRKITSGGVVTTLANGPFGALGGIALDAAGSNLYVTDNASRSTRCRQGEAP
jgi:DNA-binding beta-propeller fold protein YncE